VDSTVGIYAAQKKEVRTAVNPYCGYANAVRVISIECRAGGGGGGYFSGPGLYWEVQKSGGGGGG